MNCPVYFAGRSVLGYEMNDALPPEVVESSDINAKTCLLVGTCLEPLATAGEVAHLVDSEPTAWQLVALWLKGEAGGRLKVYVATVDRGDRHNPMWGEQPDKIVIVASLNPLALHLVAERDIERLASVTMLESPFWEKDVSAGVPLAPEQHEAISKALAA